ncbi:MAG: YicC family protein [Deltaproteobacteria bacterium]|nr:YicC family protein [Deltaproteobacteria bacterium]
MANSMTGYGRAGFTIEGETFSVEVKSLNHRYLDINCRMPERFFAAENRIREELKKRFSRGSFTVILSSEPSEASSLKVNIAAARAYLEAAGELRRELGISGEADVPLLLKIKDIFYPGKKTVDIDSAWEAMREGLYTALGHVAGWRAKEGSALKADILGRLTGLEGFLSGVELRTPAVNAAQLKRLKEGIEKLIGERADETRIMLEAAIFAERADVSEEAVRIRSHVDMFRQYLSMDEPVGKRLDFLCQELFRETNTIASKSNDTAITRFVVEMKSVVEKIREQVQNIE